jgi:DNA ligase D-like protein (predicted 3'-phosphoesterase)
VQGAEAASGASKARAVRAIVAAPAEEAELMQAVRDRARELGAMGWVRSAAPGTLEVHAEGAPEAVQSLLAFVRERAARSASADADAAGADADVRELRPEGHEQFAIRGVSAGAFVVQEHAATAHHFDLRLEVGGVMRSWAVPRGPSLDPAAKRLAVQVEDHAIDHNDFEGRTDHGGALLWDRGTYEQGGRVAWPEALDRGHAVFVLHGHKLRGGFALQRTRAGAKPQWLLVKRRDEQARPGSDIVAEQPASVRSGRTLDEVLRG